VKYKIDSSITDTGNSNQKAQIKGAIDEWNKANAGNNSKVKFEEAGPNDTVNLTFKNGDAASLGNFKNDEINTTTKEIIKALLKNKLTISRNYSCGLIV
ncbi:MAG: hypothetical protein L0287_35230, partial [Anaerolineae bacterium]|nr:hypothetical protein [Anaerolineae bacterium]